MFNIFVLYGLAAINIAAVILSVSANVIHHREDSSVSF